MKKLIKRLTMAAVVSASCVQMAAAQNNTKQGMAYKSLPLILADSKGHFFAELTIEGKKAYYLADSGCSTYFVTSKQFTDSLNKKLTVAGKAETLHGVRTQYSTKLDSMKLGNAKSLKSVATRVVDFGKVSKLSVGGKKQSVDGLLGSPIFKSLRATIDYENSRLLFAPKAATKGTYMQHRKKAGDFVISVVQSKEGYPYVPMRLNGKKFLFLIDSGAPINILTPDSAKMLGLKYATKEGKLPVVRITNPILGHIQLPKMDFAVRAAKPVSLKAQGYSYGGILGTKTLIELKAALDYDSYKLILSKSIMNK